MLPLYLKSILFCETLTTTLFLRDFRYSEDRYISIRKMKFKIGWNLLMEIDFYQNKQKITKFLVFLENSLLNNDILVQFYMPSYRNFNFIDLLMR